jgi:zinc protease
MRLAVLLLCVAACGNRETASPKPSPAKPAATASAKKIRSVEGITEYHLDNGLVALVFPDPTQSTVTVNITYLVGSRHEGYGETGMAHLLEHMIFKGTPTHRNVMKLLTERGAMSNGSTWFDRTNYYATLPASQDNLDFAVALNADCMRNATISAEDLASEFSVVRNEFEMDENNPQGILDERIVSTAFLWHNYGKSTIGSRADIEKVPAPALRAFYDKYYQPDNAVLVVSGKLDEAAALATIETHFGKIPRPQRKLTPTYTVEPVQDGEREVTLRRNGDVHTIGVAYHTVAATSPDFPAVEAALDVLVREPSGRLYKGLVENGLATSLWSQATPTHDPFLAQVGADVRDANAVPIVLALATSMIEGLGMSPVDAKELERWRAARLKDLELAMTDSESIAIELSEYAALGDWRTLFAYRSRVEAITAADVQRVAKLYFKRSNRTVGVFIPVQDAAADRAPHTERPDVAAYVKGIDGGTLKDQGEVFVATLDNIERRTTRAVLNGGIKAALLPKKTRGGKVQLALSLHWGDEQSLQNRATAAGLLGALMTRGTTKKTYQELQELEDKLRARISLSTTADGLVLHIETLRDHLPDAIELAMEILKSPSFPAKELELVRQETLAGLENQQQDPETIAWQTISQLTEQWPKSDPRYTQSIAEQIASVKAVKLADIKRFYTDFVGAGHGELAVVGDFDRVRITTQIARHLEGWQSKAPYTRVPDKVFDVAGTTKSIDIKDKEMTAIAIAHDVTMKDTDPDFPAWLLMSQILGGDTASRAWMRLREAEGLSYGVGTSADADAFDAVGSFTGWAIVAPQNLAKARASLLDEIGKLLTGKVAADELKRAKETWLKEQDASLSNDGYVLQMLALQLFRDRTTAYATDLRTKIAAVTADDIARVAKKYLDPKRLVVVDAGDLAKQKPQ